MNAVEFVKNEGWDVAQETVKENSKQLRILSTWEVELKHLVDSWELVEKHGGVNGAIEATGSYYIKPSEWEDLNQAIRDVESVGGGV